MERQVSSESGQLAASRPGRSQPQFPHFALQLSSLLGEREGVKAIQAGRARGESMPLVQTCGPVQGRAALCPPGRSPPSPRGLLTAGCSAMEPAERALRPVEDSGLLRSAPGPLLLESHLGPACDLCLQLSE